MKFSTAFLTTPGSILASLLVGFIILFSSISCAGQPADSLKKDSPKYLSFYENADGERIHWEANFLGDEITSIYKNGQRIPDDLVNDYKDKIYDQLDEMRFGSDRFIFRMPEIVGEDFHLDMDELQKNLKEMEKNLPNHEGHFKFYKFDDKKFKKEMEDLKKELEKNKSEIYEWKFDDKEFKEQMEELQKQLKENLPKLKQFHFHIDCEDEDTEV